MKRKRNNPNAVLDIMETLDRKGAALSVQNFEHVQRCIEFRVTVDPEIEWKDIDPILITPLPVTEALVRFLIEGFFLAGAVIVRWNTDGQVNGIGNGNYEWRDQWEKSR